MMFYPCVPQTPWGEDMNIHPSEHRLTAWAQMVFLRTTTKVPFIKRFYEIFHFVWIWLPWVDRTHHKHACKLVFSCLKENDEEKCRGCASLEFHRKSPEAIGLWWWGLQGILQPSLVVGILVITQGFDVLVVLTDWMRGKKYLWTLTLAPCFTLTWSYVRNKIYIHSCLAWLWNQMPENLQKFFYRQGSVHIFLFQG